VASFERIAHGKDNVGFNEEFVRKVLDLQIGDRLEAPDNY
jgi:hypothetical protein